MQYAVVIEQTLDGGYSAYVPDLPVCFTVGDSFHEVKQHIRDAIETYLDVAQEEGIRLPSPSARIELIDIAA